jgi:cyclopropane fatty-acyl-phospholipid synthase-like methyltransferase
MGKLVNYATSLHKATKRAYIDRMVDDKVSCMIKAKEYEFDYWDGDRRFGYGGYKYMPGRWKVVAETLIKNYGLTNSSSILDVGCGKGFLLYEMKLLLPDLRVVGFDASKHGIANAKEEISKNLFIHQAQTKYPFKDSEFDLVISLGKEIERVGKNGYLMLESYRSEQELFNLECWALTCESFFDPEEWKWIYSHFGYSGDYEFIYFE